MLPSSQAGEAPLNTQRLRTPSGEGKGTATPRGHLKPTIRSFAAWGCPVGEKLTGRKSENHLHRVRPVARVVAIPHGGAAAGGGAGQTSPKTAKCGCCN
jgi:hypothetical protein